MPGGVENCLRRKASRGMYTVSLLMVNRSVKEPFTKVKYR
jgi:hypothetical protein